MSETPPSVPFSRPSPHHRPAQRSQLERIVRVLVLAVIALLLVAGAAAWWIYHARQQRNTQIAGLTGTVSTQGDQIVALQSRARAGRDIAKQFSSACKLHPKSLPVALCASASRAAVQPLPTPVVGPAGANGQPGVQGLTGPRGEPGVRGVAGPRGLTGPAGGVGPQGAPGLNGAPGADATGVQGDTGPQGPQGDQGPAGPSGANGADGRGITSVDCTGLGVDSLTITYSDGSTQTVPCNLATPTPSGSSSP